MFDRIKHLLSDHPGSPRLTEMKPEERVAVCAILLEVAEADRDEAPLEFREVTTQLQNHFGLSEAEVEELIALTEAQREASTDLWPFTTALARDYTPERKQEVLAMVWQVIFADGKLDPYEDHLARRLQAMLSVNHSVLMAAKAQARAVQKQRAQSPG